LAVYGHCFGTPGGASEAQVARDGWNHTGLKVPGTAPTYGCDAALGTREFSKWLWPLPSYTFAI